jgi:hypothetical protein
MEERFFALTGNEFGVHMDESIPLVSREQAEEDYSRFLEDYGCASLHEVREGGIVRVKMEDEF